MSMKRTITGQWCNNERIVAFCAMSRHKGYLTKGQGKAHGCLKKNCRFYVPLKKMENDRKKKCNKEGELRVL